MLVKLKKSNQEYYIYKNKSINEENRNVLFLFLYCVEKDYIILQNNTFL